MSEERYEEIEGEDFSFLTLEKRATYITPWNTRIINNTSKNLKVNYHHTNLMVRLLVISELEDEPVTEAPIIDELTTPTKEKIKSKIGKKI